MMLAPSAHGCRRRRSQRRRRKKNEELHETVLAEILWRLPVNSLLRFKCVCKSWYSLITDPHFVSMHLNNHAPTCLLVYNIDRPNVSVLSLTVDTNVSATLVDMPIPASVSMKAFQPDLFDFFTVHGPCNGIICISGVDDRITLWNPATKESKLLPWSNVCHFPVEGCEECEYRVVSEVGFGYDAKTNDYKVLQTEMLSYTARFRQFGLYSLRNDSWKKLDPNIDYVPLSYRWHGAISISFQNNINICWLGLTKRGDVWDNWVIVLFDMSDEKFSIIALPSHVLETLAILRRGALFTFGESLALVCYHQWDEKDGFASFDIWVSPNFCAQPTLWIKLFSTDDQQPVTYRPMGFLEEGCILFQYFNDGGEFLFDPRTAKQMNLQPQGCCVASSRAFAFKESLIAIS